MIPRFEPTADTGEIIAFLRGLLFPGRWSGDLAKGFERCFADYLGGGHALFVPSGRMGLLLLLEALGYERGDEVVVPAFTYFAIPAVIRHAGLKPVFADIERGTYELSVSTVERVVTVRTRAVIPTHLFGRTCDMTELGDLCRTRGLDIIEDCAQSLGAVSEEKKAGLAGRASYFTFGITKNFTTFSGGMVLCREKEIFDRMAARVGRFRAVSPARLAKEGFTALAMRLATGRLPFSLSLAPLLKRSPLDGPDWIHRAFEERPHDIDDRAVERLSWRPRDIQARAGLRQLTTIDGKNGLRREKGGELLGILEKTGCRGLPARAPSAGDHIFMSFAITRKDRYRFAAAMRRLGIDVSPGYMADCSASSSPGVGEVTCPVAAAVAREIIHLPLYPGLSSRDLLKIGEAVAEADSIQDRQCGTEG